MLFLLCLLWSHLHRTVDSVCGPRVPHFCLRTSLQHQSGWLSRADFLGTTLKELPLFSDLGWGQTAAQSVYSLWRGGVWSPAGWSSTAGGGGTGKWVAGP